MSYNKKLAIWKSRIKNNKKLTAKLIKTMFKLKKEQIRFLNKSWRNCCRDLKMQPKNDDSAYGLNYKYKS